MLFRSTKPAVTGTEEKATPATADQTKTPDVKPVEPGKPDVTKAVKPMVDKVKGKASAPVKHKKP